MLKHCITNNQIYFSSFIYLLHRITSNTRFIYLEINRNPNVKVIKCYSVINISDLEKEMIEDISNDILSITDEFFEDKYLFFDGNDVEKEIVTTDYLLFARYEA